MCAFASRHRDPQDRHDAEFERNFWAASELVDRGGRGRSARHAQRPSPNNAARIGRVGALAVSLGVGFAVANAAGVAYADTDTDASTSTGSGSDARTKSSSPKPSLRAGADEAESSGGSNSDDDSAAGEPGGPEDPVGEGNAEEDDAADDPEDVPPSEVAQGDDPAPEADVAETPNAPVGSDTPTAPEGSGAVDVVDEVTTPEAGDIPAADHPATDVVPVDMTVPTTAPESVASAAPEAEAEDSVASVDVMTAVVSSVLSPFTNPATPARAPWFDAVLAWVRRQIVHTFFNESPEWGPVETQQTVTGQVLIDLKAVDPNGDPLTYKIVQPQHGVVFRDPLSGKFVYTPTTVVTGAPLRDVFTVTISDSSEHLKGLLGVIQGVFHYLRRAAGLAEPDDVTLMIPIVANPIVELAPIVVVTPVAAAVIGQSVTVSPVLVINDLDSDELTSATVTLSGTDTDFVFDWGDLPSGVSATAGARSITFTGKASIGAYRDLLASVTLAAGSAGIRTVTFSVTDERGLVSAPVGTAVTVLGLPVDVPPLVVTLPVAAGLAGSTVKVTPIVVITDLDSDELVSATVTVVGGGASDVLDWDDLPEGVSATQGIGTVTFNGAASLQEYRDLLASVTLTSPTAGVKTVTFMAVDEDGNQSPSAATIVTLVGLPNTDLNPVMVVLPVAAGLAGNPVRVSPIVVITDLDSDRMRSATVTVVGNAADAELAWSDLPDGITATPGAGSVTFTGLASVAAYRDLLSSVTLTSPSAGIKSVTFAVTDEENNQSLSVATAVTIVGLPGSNGLAPVLVALPAAAGLAGSPVRVSPVVVLTDLDSQIKSATVSITNPGAGDALAWDDLPAGVVTTATSGAVTSVTFTGAASAQVYQAVLQSITLSSTAAGIKTVTFQVSDVDDNASAVSATLVTVVGLPTGSGVAPVLVALPAAAGLAGSPVRVSPVVVLTDLDSQIKSATVSITNPGAGDALSWEGLPAGVSTTATSGSVSSVTFTGAASAQVYQAVLQSITLNSAAAGIKTVTFQVSDVDDNASAVSATLVTVVGLPTGSGVAPILVALPAAAGLTGSPVRVSPVVVLTDLDSQIKSATVSITNPGAGDTLAWDDLPAGVSTTATSGAVTSVTFTGAASAQVYQAVLQSITLNSTAAGIKTVTFQVSDVDDNASATSATLVTVVGLPTSSGVAPVLVALPAAAGLAGDPINVSPVVVLTDLDSQIKSATVSITNPGAGDTLAWDDLPAGVSTTATSGAVTSVTFTGAASAQVYQAVLQSITLSSAGAGIKTVSFTVTDVDDNASATSATAVTVVGLPVGDGLAPVLVALPAAAGLAGEAITVSPMVVLTDLDSQIKSATVSITSPAAGDALAWDDLPAGVSTTATSGAVTSVTFTGAASAQVYQSVLQSITFSSAGAGVKTVTFQVTDVDENLSAVSGTLVTVVGLPTGSGVSPVLVALPAAAGLTGSPVRVSPVVVLTDLDSEITSATVSITNPGAGDVLAWDDLPAGVSTTATSGAVTSVTFTGAASAQVYQAVLQSITLNSTAAGIKTVTFQVSDVDDNASAVSATLVTVVGLPTGDGLAPVLVALPAAAGLAGSPVRVSPVVVLTDLDSQIKSATVSITNPGAGDVLAWDTLPPGVSTTATSGSVSSVTFTGAASAQVYQAVLQSITLSSTAAGIKTVTFQAVDVDENVSATSATAVTVVGLPTGGGLGPMLVALPAAAGLTGSPVRVSPVVVLTDLDSQITSATVSITNPGAGDALAWDNLPAGVATTATSGAVSSVTFTGAASAQVYQAVLQSVTLNSAAAGIKTVTFQVTDVDDNASAMSATAVTVVGLPVGDGLTPVLVALPAAAGLAGEAITVSPMVVLTDLDSQIKSATVSINSPAAGDALAWDDLPAGVVTTATSGAVTSVTFTGAASAQVYQSVLQSITFSSAGAGVKTVTFQVTDVDENLSAVSGTLVTVVGLPTGSGVSPVLVALPAAAGLAGDPINVSPVVVLTDLDSQIKSATVSITNPGAGDTLAWDTLPSGVATTATSGSVSSVTFTGAASAQVYQSVLQSITLDSTAAGIKTVTFQVSDVDDNASAVSATLVTVVGLPTGSGVAPVLVALPAAAGLTGSPVRVSPVVVLTDLDSQIKSATVSITNPGAGDALAWDDLPAGVATTATSGAVSSVTFTGAASAQVYQAVLQSVTVNSAAAGIKTVTFQVTDVDDNASAMSATLVTVVGLPTGGGLGPVLVALPAAAGLTGSPVRVSPVVVLTDLDSLVKSATVSITNPGAGDTLAWDDLPSGVATTATSGAVTSVTFTGAASAQVYQAVLQSITLSSATAGIKTVSFTVTDVDDNASATSATAVTVVGLPTGDGLAPVLVALPAAAGLAGDPISVSPVVVLTDLDSLVKSATVSITNPGAGDTLAWDTLPSGVATTATSGAVSSVTFTGAASAQVYQAVLQSITLNSATAGIKTVTFQVSDVDENASAVSATLVTVVGMPTSSGLTPVLVALPAAAGLAGDPISVSPVVVLTDLDSQIESATVSIINPGAGDTLAWDDLPSGVATTATSGAVTSVTFTGAASAQVYQAVLQSITFSSAGAGVKTVSFTVTDVDDNASATSATAVTVVGLPTGDGLAPILVALPAAAGLAGDPINVSPVVVLTDLDSLVKSATVSITNPGAGDALAWDDLPAGVVTTATSGAVTSVTFTGAASAQVYQSVLQSITLSSATAGIKTVSFTVTDVDDNASATSATAVTVVGLPTGGGLAPVLVVLPAAAGLAGDPINVSPVVVLADLDSLVKSATVSITNPGAGDTLAWDDLPAGVATTATSGAVSSVTFTGAASAQVYQAVLQSITLNSAGGGIKMVTYQVSDVDDNASAVSATLVTVVGMPTSSGLTPILVALPAAAGLAGDPIAVSPVIVLTDLDSQIKSATVSINSPAAGDTLAWDDLPAGVVTTATSGAVSSVTFTGAVSAQVYQSVLQSITLSSTTAGIKTVTFQVTDVDENISATSATAVTVVGLPTNSGLAPVLSALPAAVGLSGSPVTVSPVVALTDLDSQIQSATVTITNPAAGDVLAWDTPPSGVSTTATSGAVTSVTFTGGASAQAYRDLLASVTLTSSSAGLQTVTFKVVDVNGNASAIASTVVTVVGLPTSSGLAPVLVTLPAAAGVTGSPVTVSPVVVLTDIDSNIESATVSINSPAAGDTLAWDDLPAGVATTATSGAVTSVTFTGAASAQVYQALLQSITINSATAGIKTVTFRVTDATANLSAPTVTQVTLVGLPSSQFDPILVASLIGLTYTAGGTEVPVDSGVLVLDVDSQTMKSATVTIGDVQVGDVLSVGPVPGGMTAVYSGGVLTITGPASVSVYQDLLRSVKFSTSSSAVASIKAITFRITDQSDRVSAPATVSVAVLSLPTTAAPAVVTSVVNVSYTAGNSATVIDPNLTILDADSSNLSGAVVAIVGGVAAGEELSFTPQTGISGTYNPATGVLTFNGTASKEAYQQVLRSVTFATNSTALATIKSISFAVTDAQSNTSVPGLVAVTVLNTPVNVPPLVITSGVSVSYTAGNSAVTVDSGVSLLELDSTTLEGATVRINGGFSAGDVLTFAEPSGIEGNYNAGTGVLTFTGDASVADYQLALRSVQLSTASSALATIKTVSFTVTDVEGSTSLPGSVGVTVLAAPVNLAPLVTTLLGPIYTAGNTAVQVNPLLTVLDLDTANMSSASVAITENFALGDVLNFTPVAGINGTYDSSTGVLAFTGTATALQYQQLLQSVTFSSGASASTMVKTLTFTVTDALGATSPGATVLVTQRANTAPVVTAPLGLILLSAPIISPTAAIVDDSSYLDRAVVTLTNVQSGDSLAFTPTGSITGAYSGGVLTLTGLGTAAEYQTVLRSVRFSKSALNLVGFRDITVAVRDTQGLTSNTATGTITFVL